MPSQVPVVLEKALRRQKSDERKAVEEQHFFVIPARYRREVSEYNPKSNKAGNVKHNLRDVRDDEICAVVHLGFYVLRDDFKVYFYVK